VSKEICPECGRPIVKNGATVLAYGKLWHVDCLFDHEFRKLRERLGKKGGGIHD